jgi:hypothetical protein
MRKFLILLFIAAFVAALGMRWFQSTNVVTLRAVSEALGGAIALFIVHGPIVVSILIFMVLCLPGLRGEALPQQRVAQQREEWHMQGCDFRVTFPFTPTLTNMQAAGLAYQRAELVTDSSLLRAECVPRSLGKEQILAGLKAQAEDDGLKNWSVQEILPNIHSLRGYKTIQGRSATYVIQIHSGDSSVLTLTVAAASEDYPTSATEAFLNSVQMQGDED